MNETVLPSDPQQPVWTAPAYLAGTPRHWALKRNCSTDPRRFLLTSAVLVGTPLLVGLALLAGGLWMGTVVCGLESLLVAGALVCFARHAVDGERLSLRDDGKLVVEVACGQQLERHAFTAAWTRLQWQGRRRDELWLCEGRRRLRIGRHVRLPMRRAVADSLQRALRAATAPAH